MVLHVVFPQLTGVYDRETPSPFLFTVVADLFSVNRNPEYPFSGFQVGKDKVEVRISKYVYDTILFIDAHMNGIKTGEEGAPLFYGFWPRVEGISSSILATGDGGISKKISDIEERLLMFWGELYGHYDEDGRPQYTISQFFKIPKKIAATIYQWHWNFLWDRGGDARPAYLLKETRYAGIHRWGYWEVENMVHRNTSMLAKCFWRFMNEGDERRSIWESLYGVTANGGTYHQKLQLFAKSMEGWEIPPTFELFLKVELGDGNKTSFWHDKWQWQGLEGTFSLAVLHYLAEERESGRFFLSISLRFPCLNLFLRRSIRDV